MSEQTGYQEGQYYDDVDQCVRYWVEDKLVKRSEYCIGKFAWEGAD